MQPLQGKVIMWSYCPMLGRCEMAFKYNDEMNVFGTKRVIIIMSLYSSLKFYLDDNEKKWSIHLFLLLLLNRRVYFVLVFFFLGL